MEQPPGYVKDGSEHLVCQLLHSIYGLKQSPRTWYGEIDQFLQNVEWACNNADPNLYIFRQDIDIILLLLYVDDFLITWND